MTKIRSSAMFALAVVPFVVAVVVLVTGVRWFPAGDMAQAELHMRGFFGHPPLVGAAGRIVSDTGFQGSHPGPSLWVAMLPVYLIGGSSSDALLAAAASVHIASIAVILLLAHRRGGRVLTWSMAIVIAAVVRSAGTDFMIEPWNPWLALLPFIVFMFLIFDLVDEILWRNRHPAPGSSRNLFTLAAAIAVGSHCVQSHAGYALLVVPPLALALLFSTAQSVRDGADPDVRRRWWRRSSPILVATGTTFFVWLPPFLDQMRRTPGNLTILLQHFGSPEEPTLGLAKSWNILSTQLNLVGPWLVGPGGTDVRTLHWLGFGLFVALCGSALVASVRLRMRVHTTSLLTLVGFMVLGAISIVRIFGPYYEYTVRWLWMIAASTVAVSLWTISCVLGERGSVRDRSRTVRFASDVVPAVVLTVLAAVSVWQVVDRVKLPGATDSRILSGLIDDTVDALDPSKTYQIRFYDPYTLNATGFGLLLELERRGFDVKVDPEFAAAALPHRTAPMEATDAVLWVVVGPTLDKAIADPNLQLIASFNPRSPEEQRRSKVLLEEVEQGLRTAGREDLVASLQSPGASILFADPPLPESTAALVRELITMGQPTGVFVMSVGDVADSLG